MGYDEMFVWRYIGKDTVYFVCVCMFPSGRSWRLWHFIPSPLLVTLVLYLKIYR